MRDTEGKDMKKLSVAVFGMMIGLVSCDDGGPAGQGRVRILLSAEDSISEGLRQGAAVEDTRDYGVHFTKYLVTVGRVTMGRSRDARTAQLDEVFVIDATQVGSDGVELGMIDDLRAGEWDKFGFETPRAGDDAQRFAGVSEQDFAEMVREGYTYWIEGEVERPAAQGGPVSFAIKTAVPTRYSDCEHDGEPGVSVVADGSETAIITLHGDHMFFNAFLTGSEANIERLAGYLVEADQDGDGHVDERELTALDATRAFTRARGYSLDGAPLLVDNGFDFVRAQLATQGHYQGEGECIFTLSDEE
jgi:hypothetical protein